MIINQDFFPWSFETLGRIIVQTTLIEQSGSINHGILLFFEENKFKEISCNLQIVDNNDNNNNDNKWIVRYFKRENDKFCPTTSYDHDGAEEDWITVLTIVAAFLKVSPATYRTVRMYVRLHM